MISSGQHSYHYMREHGLMVFFFFCRDNKMNLIRPIIEELNDLDSQQKECEDKIAQVIVGT